ncbi:MAG TPA: serine/threonine-protein kinase, partial [Candidatus Polarisedimenticolia bacterium]|nr:serine/threonine-protein kinase [Candidatus Polarisedimenticolia bacterium]
MARCPSCLREVPEGRFCLACGQPLPASSEVPTRLEARSPAPSSPTLHHGRFLPGMHLAGRYRIVAPLGKGGMGEVYRADDLKLGQVVALKFLPEEVERDERRLGLLLNEVRTARQISHPNVCRAYDIGEVDGHHFLSMEYVDGEDLASLLRRIGRLPKDKGIEIARQISAGLGAAHEAGVLHRDLKPANIMIDGRGRVRITDFGLAAAAGEVGGDEARAGTPAYMAPEQLAGQAFTLRSDLYALGLVLYELFTGRPPFRASTPGEFLKLQTTSTPAPPSSVIEGLEPAVERVILRCLDPEPSRRPSSVLAVVSALPGGDPLAAALAAGETPSPELVAAAGESAGLSHRAAVAVLGAVLGGIGLLLWISGGKQALPLARLEKPPAVLTERAREIIHDLGYKEKPVDSLIALEPNTAYLRHLAEEKRPLNGSKGLSGEQPAVIHFRYRQSPRFLERISFGSLGDWFSDPPPTVPGMVEVTLDPQGRLLSFTAVPGVECRASAAAPDPDWTRLLGAAGFDASALAAAEPTRTPPVYADRRAAWTGTYPQEKDVPVRLDAAALAGQPVAFRLVEPWDLLPKKGDDAPRGSSRIGSLVRSVTFLVAVTTALVVALRNLRRGRGDRKGTLRFAIYLGAVRLLWLAGAHHLPVDVETDLLIGHLAWSMYRVGMVCIFYLALEPYA